MRGHLSFRSGNPALTKDTFNTKTTDGQVMTLDGTVNKTSISLLILLVCSYYTFSTANTGLIWVGFIVGSIHFSGGGSAS